MTPHTAAADEKPQWQWPLRFSEHSFTAYCYDTYGCRVRYAGLTSPDDGPDEYSESASTFGSDYQKNWGGGHIGIRNFPEPAEVSWRSRDGTTHDVQIDIGAIFADQHVVHRAARGDIPAWATIGPPSIILEVNDRTLNVYMRAMVPTKQEQTPGNRYSRARDEVILVKTFNY